LGTESRFTEVVFVVADCGLNQQLDDRSVRDLRSEELVENVTEVEQLWTFEFRQKANEGERFDFEPFVIVHAEVLQEILERDQG